MEENVKAKLQRVVNVYQELVDILVERAIEVPNVNASLRDVLGEETYQELVAKLLECGQADAIAAAYIR